MTLIQKYVKYVNDASFVITELVILLPICIVAYLFYPDVEFTLRLLIFGIIASAVSLFHIFLGVIAIINNDVMGTLNFLVIPIIVFGALVYLGYR